MGHSFLIKPIFYERKSDNSVIAAGNQSGIHFSCVYLYGVMLLLSVIISLHFWFKDLIREFYKKYEVLLMILFLACFIFLVSEGLLFISFFWGTFHSLSSPNYGMCPGEGLYVPDPCELTFANTLLLSNAAVSLGGAVVSLESSCSFSILFSLFSLLTGLHFFHLVVGLFLLSLYYCSCSFHCKIDNLVTVRSSEVHLYYNLQVFYWHFLESLWLFIFLVLYLAYGHVHLQKSQNIVKHVSLRFMRDYEGPC